MKTPYDGKVMSKLIETSASFHSHSFSGQTLAEILSVSGNNLREIPSTAFKVKRKRALDHLKEINASKLAIRGFIMDDKKLLVIVLPFLGADKPQTPRSQSEQYY